MPSSSFSMTDERILRTLNLHMSLGEQVSVTSLAEECNVAKSTIVKMAKKLGYQGFSDLKGDLLRGREDEVSDTYLPLEVTSGTDSLSAAAQLAEDFWRCHRCKNVLMSGDASCLQIVSSYLDRKLRMFDIDAAATYDYATIIPVSLKPGTALFFEHNVAMQDEGNGIVLAVSRPHFRLARQQGYHIVLITDEAAASVSAQLSDEVIEIRRSSLAGVDLFIPRTIMLFELMLSELSRIAQQEKADSREEDS